MNKLVNYFLRKNGGKPDAPGSMSSSSGGGGGSPTASPSASLNDSTSSLPEVTPEERSEIFQTLRKTRGSHATQALISRLKEEDRLVQAIGADRQTLESAAVAPTTSESSDSDADDGGGDFSTMRVLPDSDEWSTMRMLPDCPSSIGSTGSSGSIGSEDASSAPKRSGSVERVGLVNRPTKADKKKKSSLSRAGEKRGSSSAMGSSGAAGKKRGTVGSSVSQPPASDEPPAFMSAFREPEEWELNILALEKGEAREGMGNPNSAFKRWKKERPSVPSMLLKGPTDEVVAASSPSS